MSERDLQKAVAQYLDLKRYRWCHVPNGARLGSGKVAAIRGKRLKEEGLKPGVPDCMIYEPWFEKPFGHADPCYCEICAENEAYGQGIAIELKIHKAGTKAGDPTEKQQEWLDALEARGWYVDVCRSLDEVKALCKRVLVDVRR